jgi:antitoxin VapB
MYIHLVYTERVMAKEYRAKVFKSGNSVALRLPKALGIKEGTEMRLREGPAGFEVQPIETPAKTIDISGFAGKMPGFKPPLREEFEERPSTVARRKGQGAA